MKDVNEKKTTRPLNTSFENNASLPLSWSLSVALFFTPQTIKPPPHLSLGWHSLWGISLLWPSFAWQSNKAIISPSPKTLVSTFLFGTSEQRLNYGNKFPFLFYLSPSLSGNGVMSALATSCWDGAQSCLNLGNTRTANLSNYHGHNFTQIIFP